MIISSEKIPVFALAFGVAFAVVYTICTEVNLPLLTYHPAIGEIDFLWQAPKRGPAMYWYGWMLTSLIAALMLAWVAASIPESWLQRAITFGWITAVAYLMFYTVALFIYDRATIEMEFLKSRWLSGAAAVIIAAFISCLVPRAWNKRVWHGWIWLVPIGAVVVLAYYLTPYFTQ